MTGGALRRPVHVEVLHRHQLGPCRRGAIENTCLERWKQFGPPCVGRVETLIHDGRTRSGVLRECWIGGVATPHLDTNGHLGSAAAVDDTNAMSPSREKLDGGHPDWPGPEDDVEVAPHS